MESPPLNRFLHSLGRVQHHLHTAIVGLSAVERGTATKPNDLDIAWQAHDPVGSAREARRFLLRATLIFLSEELKEYATHVLRYRGLIDGSAQVPASRFERIQMLCTTEEIQPSYLAIAPLIVSHWRNRIVHRDSKPRRFAAERQLLLSQAEAVHRDYKGIEIPRLLRDFESDQPTLKDVTALLAMCIKFVRHVDSLLPEPTSSKYVRLWLEAEDMLVDVLKLEKEAGNGGSLDPRGRAMQYLLTKAPSLAKAYYLHGAA